MARKIAENVLIQTPPPPTLTSHLHLKTEANFNSSGFKMALTRVAAVGRGLLHTLADNHPSIRCNGFIYAARQRQAVVLVPKTVRKPRLRMWTEAGRTLLTLTLSFGLSFFLFFFMLLIYDTAALVFGQMGKALELKRRLVSY